MKELKLARRLAEKTRVSNAAAKDQVEETVRKILTALRKGRQVKLPGVGKLVPGTRSKPQ